MNVAIRLEQPMDLVAIRDVNLAAAVLPGSQGQGIGSLLVTTGLDHCRRIDVGCVVVLGHPDYYPRFGFRPASQFGIGCEYDVPAQYLWLPSWQMARGAVSPEPLGTNRHSPAYSDCGCS